VFIPPPHFWGVTPLWWGKHKNPPMVGKGCSKPYAKNRMAKLSPTAVFLFLFFDNADMYGTTMETENMKMIRIEIRILETIVDMLRTAKYDAAKWRILTDTMENL
jgi:hypothetical protein